MTCKIWNAPWLYTLLTLCHFNLPVAETLSDDVLQKMHAPPKPAIPVIKVDELTEPDGIIFGIPTRFGTMPAQIKA